jgi:hypothetical protein
MNPGGSSTSLSPNLSFLPKVLSDRHVCLCHVFLRLAEACAGTDCLCGEDTVSERVLGAGLSKQRFSLDRVHDYNSILPGWQASAGICGGTFNTRCGCFLGSTEWSAPR